MKTALSRNDKRRIATITRLWIRKIENIKDTNDEETDDC